MYKVNQTRQIEELLIGYEKLTKEYKKIKSSKEYTIGTKIQQYKKLIKNYRFIEIFKRVFGRNKKYNEIIDYEKNNINNKKYFSDKKIAVYTAIFGEYDNLLEPIIKPDNIDYFIITDQNINSNMWKKIELSVLPDNLRNNVEKNRYCKMFPNKLFKEYEYSIYVDGNVLITSDLTPLVEQMDSFPIAMHKHKNRDCVYKEIEACIKKGKANKEDLIRHKNLLLKNKVPGKSGLLEATVIARYHNDERCKNLMEEWWNEFLDYSKRDQISLIDVLWKNNISIDEVAILGKNILLNDLFVIIPHK